MLLSDHFGIQLLTENDITKGKYNIDLCQKQLLV